MRCRRITFCFLLPVLLFLLSCTPPTQLATQTSLYVYHFDSASFVEFSADFQPTNELPFSIPSDCGLLDVYPAPIGWFLLIELSCPNGQTVLLLDTESGAITQPVTDSDAHFLAWTSDGSSAYLKVDSLGNARVVRMYMDGRHKDMDVNGWTYDLAARPDSDDFIFTFSRGLGTGSELNFTQNKGRSAKTLYGDKFNYISFARYSPDGSQIAFLKIPDTQTPFTVGELWVMGSDGTNPRKLADADAGHGYAANWSPDGIQIAFVKRENPEDEGANQSSASLISNIYLINLQNGEEIQLTHFTTGRAETPHWSPDGNTLAFNKVLNGRMEVQIADVNSGKILPLLTDTAPSGGSTCCPAWMRK